MEIKRVSVTYTVKPSTEAHDQKDRRDAEAESKQEEKRRGSPSPSENDSDQPKAGEPSSQMPDSEHLVELLSFPTASRIRLAQGQAKRLIAAFSDERKQKKL